MRDMLARLKLMVNEAKTRLCQSPDEPFDFLGYTLGRCYWWKTGWAYIGVQPSAKKILGLYREIHEQTGRPWLWLEPGEMVARLNRLLGGWANYFCLGTVAAAYRKVTAHVCYRLRRWLARKYRVRGSGWSRFPDHYLYTVLGLLRLQRRPVSFSRA
jgi:hypothetical protein